MSDSTHFIVTTNLGFRVHEVVSGMVKINCKNIIGGLSQCQSYGRSNIFFLVGSGSNPDLPRSKLSLWDDQAKEFIAEVSFFNPILYLKVVGDWVVLAD